MIDKIEIPELVPGIFACIVNLIFQVMKAVLI